MFKLYFAKVVAYLIAFVAAVSSYGHQVHLLELADLDPLFGLIPSEWITPITVDSLAIIGLMVRTSDTVTVSARRWALLPLVLAGGMSVAANVATARNVVQVVVGVWTVAAYIIAELFVGKMEKKSTEQVQPVPVSAPVQAPASVPAPAEVLDPEAKAPDTVAELTDMPEAPVSPAPRTIPERTERRHRRGK
jgi:hypothetical protein